MFKCTEALAFLQVRSPDSFSTLDLSQPLALRRISVCSAAGGTGRLRKGRVFRIGSDLLPAGQSVGSQEKRFLSDYPSPTDPLISLYKFWCVKPGVAHSPPVLSSLNRHILTILLPHTSNGEKKDMCSMPGLFLIIIFFKKITSFYLYNDYFL